MHIILGQLVKCFQNRSGALRHLNDKLLTHARILSADGKAVRRESLLDKCPDALRDLLKGQAAVVAATLPAVRRIELAARALGGLLGALIRVGEVVRNLKTRERSVILCARCQFTDLVICGILSIGRRRIYWAVTRTIPQQSDTIGRATTS